MFPANGIMIIGEIGAGEWFLVILKGAEPFLLPGSKQGVLLIHGFTGSPSEMRLLGEFLQKLGYTVLAPRLCGHGTSAAEMAETKWPHWYDAVQDGYHLLQGLCTEISVVGLSMGGLLSLKLAVDYPVSKVACLSAPIYIADKRLPLLNLVRMFRNFVPKKRRRLEVDPLYSVCYDQTPLSSLSSLLALIKHVNQQLPDMDKPVLIMQSRREHTVQPKSARHIYDRVGSSDKRLIWLEKSGHIITLDVERDLVFKQIKNFLQYGN
ncbi:carboxylesterase [Dendrosporobacter quercicolus]|uniref:Carboxylesterase n=1 Tax=Dendrosporobacter quercicolus TaxID=146817 RepID=A0A1G9YUE6_9FIRM|nr:carboxylesterase [Dendrosporobacter quercicolus]